MIKIILICSRTLFLSNSDIFLQEANIRSISNFGARLYHEYQISLFPQEHTVCHQNDIKDEELINPKNNRFFSRITPTLLFFFFFQVTQSSP